MKELGESGAAKAQKIKDMTDAAIEALLAKTLKGTRRKFSLFKADRYPYLVSVSTRKGQKIEFELDENFRSQIAALPDQVRQVEELLETLPNLKRVYRNI